MITLLRASPGTSTPCQNESNPKSTESMFDLNFSSMVGPGNSGALNVAVESHSVKKGLHPSRHRLHQPGICKQDKRLAPESSPQNVPPELPKHLRNPSPVENTASCPPHTPASGSRNQRATPIEVEPPIRRQLAWQNSPMPQARRLHPVAWPPAGPRPAFHFRSPADSPAPRPPASSTKSHWS